MALALLEMKTIIKKNKDAVIHIDELIILVMSIFLFNILDKKEISVNSNHLTNSPINGGAAYTKSQADFFFRKPLAMESNSH